MHRFSTQDMIHFLGEKEQCPDSDIVRLIHIYYANYVSDGNPATRLSLSEMKEIHTECQSLIENFQSFSQFAKQTSSPNMAPSPEEIEDEFIGQLPPHHAELWKPLSPVRYQMRMLGDIGATLLFVSDITNRILERSEGERFFGIDLGTGSGILLAAQDILARKYGIRNRELYGIEYDKEVAEKTQKFCHALGYHIMHGDSTCFETWKRIPKGHIDFISNENIPAANERMHREPFFENMGQLYQSRGKDVSEKTGFSPKHVTVIQDPETVDTPVIYQAAQENKFCSDIIAETRERFLNNGLGDYLFLLMPQSITLEGKNMPLKRVSEIGDERLGNSGYKRSFMSRF